MKNRTLIVVCCAAWIALANHLSAAIRPSFWGDDCAWNASDIVVVAQKEKSNGMVTVLETWHGQLAKGDRIHVAGLPQTPMTSSTLMEDMSDQMLGKEPSTKAKVVGGERIVLFLKPVEVKPDTEVTSTSGIKRFQGASSWTTDRDRVSAVWFEQGQAYAFMQFMNPGPSELYLYGGSEEDLKKFVLPILAVRDSLEKAKSLEQPSDRVAALLPLTKETCWQAKREALAAMAKCGKTALPALMEMVGNEAYFPGHVLDAVAEASGTDAGKEITAILEKELVFWKTEGPKLTVGWWNSAGKLMIIEERVRRDKHQDRYCILRHGLWVLEKQPYPPSRELVTEIRDFWTSLPQLNTQKEIIETCEKILNVLEPPHPPGTPSAGGE